MRTLKHLSMPLLAALVLCLVGVAQAAPSDWERIDLVGPIETQLPDNTTRTLYPSCSGGPELTDKGDLVIAGTDYYFFVQGGNPNRLLINLDGGGACWDAGTCVGSPLTGNSTYTVSLDGIPARLAAAEGIFDNRNSANPFQNYTKIFIPYCSGDVHWGSKDSTYELAGLPTWTIRHRGADNFLAVLDWLQKHGRKQYQVDLGRAKDVTVTGASAGGYGALLAFTYVAELTPKARLNLITDSAIGVITQDFYTTAFCDHDPRTDLENWGVEQNLPSWVPDLDVALLDYGADFPNEFVPSILAALSTYKPDAHLASLTSNLDLVQIFFYGLMKGISPPDDKTAVEWYLSMADMTVPTAALLNYRYFIDDGTFHTFIGSNEHVYQVGANGISLADWIREMIQTWQPGLG